MGNFSHPTMRDSERSFLQPKDSKDAEIRFYAKLQVVLP
jgi:hypothetical protein